MSSWSCDQRVCASCRYWLGAREVDFSGSFYEAAESEGKCCNPNGGFRGCRMGEGSSCSDWDCFK